MAQNPTRYCPSCGSAVEAGQRFCPQCGTSIEATGSSPTARNTPKAPLSEETTTSTSNAPTLASSSGLMQQGSGEGASPTPLVPPPPPGQQPFMPPSPPAPPSDPYTAYPSYPPLSASPGYSSSPGYHSAATTHGSYPSTSTQTPTPGLPPKAPRRRYNPAVVVGLLLLVVVLGIGGVLVAPQLFKETTGTEASPTTLTNAQTPTAEEEETPAATKEPKATATATTPASSEPKEVTFAQPLTFTFKSVEISITSVQQALTFPDNDSYDAKNGILRVNLKEKNDSSDYSSYYPYSDWLLVKPDGTTAKSIASKESTTVGNGVSRENWIDFSVATNVDVSKLVVRLGKSDEVQVDVPLKEGADLSKYQPKTYTLNKASKYGELDWTTIDVTSSVSFDGEQAKKNEVYLTLKVKIANNTSNTFIDSPYDYLRMKSGETVREATEQNLPVTFDPGASSEYVVTFLVPVSADGTYVLRLLGSKDSYSASSETVDIDLQLK